MSDATDVIFCKRCVISNMRPVASQEYLRAPGSEPGRIGFDAEGVCAACRVAERKAATDWRAREATLREFLEPFRRFDGRPDVICPGSGGKDSVYAAHLLKHTFGMHPLCVTWAPHAYTAVGWRNYQTWLAGGFDGILVTPNPNVHRLLTRLAFLNLLHPFQPFVLGQRSLAPRLAARFGVPLVMYGENDEEYEGRAGWQEKKETAPVETLRLGGVLYEQLLTDQKLDPADLEVYLPPTEEEAACVTVRALGAYVPWQPQAAYYFAAERGFEANEERTEGTYSKYNSIDDRLDPLHYFTAWIKFGLGRASYDAAQEIRNGHLMREEGVALVRRYDGELREATVLWAAEYMGLAEADFWAAIDAARAARPRLWTREDGAWRLRRAVWETS